MEERKKKRVKVRIKKEKPVKKFFVRNFKYRKEISWGVVLILLILGYLAYYVIWKEFNPVKKETEVILQGEDSIDEEVKKALEKAR